MAQTSFTNLSHFRPTAAAETNAEKWLDNVLLAVATSTNSFARISREFVQANKETHVRQIQARLIDEGTKKPVQDSSLRPLASLVIDKFEKELGERGGKNVFRFDGSTGSFVEFNWTYAGELVRFRVERHVANGRGEFRIKQLRTPKNYQAA
ncbi:MAG: hypothetical protein RL141_817 [Candidatus Parcubacteria bacterium]|jgi:hypothetical protein